MSQALVVLNVAIQAAFGLLAVRTVVSWVGQPDRRHGYLAIALASLALLILISPMLYGGGLPGRLTTDAGIVLYLLSGYGLLMFRDSFVPLGRNVRRGATAAIIVVGAVAMAAQLPAAEAPHSGFQSAVLVALFAVWAYCILEPIVCFWMAARDRPAVQKARLRALGVGYAGLLLVIVGGTVAGSLSEGMTLLVDLLALAVVPILYVAFFPPTWVRRLWRQPEEDQFRLALHDLLLYSPDRATLARRALGWAERLVGGSADFVLDSDGAVLATRGISEGDAAAMVGKVEPLMTNASRDGHAPWRLDSTVVVPLDLSEGPGAIIILTEGLSPMFGDDELARLRQYAASISAGLDRVALNSRIAALERAKSDFLSIASHELRGPMTVIKGYLTMVESGSLGDVSPKVRSVLPLLISKADEVNWMVEQMIEASRLEEGRLALKKRKTDIVELTDIAIDGVKILLGNHPLHVDSPAQPIETDVDPDRFQIVVRNLLSNAAKYSAGGSDIDVSVRRDGTKAFVSVKDRGVGIAAKDQSALFSRFTRIESEGHVQGTGLGLWLSREIARMHEGDLTVESEPGHGSTFTLTVPITG